MSTISEKVRAAIYTKLNVPGVTQYGSPYYSVAPRNTDFPFVVFSRMPMEVDYALGNNVVGERDQWLIKAVTDEDSSSTLSPPALAETMLNACETAIGGTLTITGNTVHMARRVREMPDYIENLNDRQIHHHGFYLEVFSE